MKTVNLRFIGINSKVIPNIYVDGQVIKCKKNDFGSYEAALQTEKDEIQISFSRELELKGRLWWLYALISFIVSVFGIFEPPYDRKCMHEFVLSGEKQKEQGANTLAIAKRLMDSNFHPPTVYFPLIVHEAIMIEPTESETKARLDDFIDTMIEIAKEIEANPQEVLKHPLNTPVRKVDETLAARKPDLAFRK